MGRGGHLHLSHHYLNHPKYYHPIPHVIQLAFGFKLYQGIWGLALTSSQRFPITFVPSSELLKVVFAVLFLLIVAGQ